MDTKKLLIGTVTGGITYFILGYVFYALLFGDFFEAHDTSNVARENIIWWALILGNLAGACLLTFIFIKWAHITTFISGLKAGAVIGLLMALSMDLIMFGTSRFMDARGAVVDVIVATVIMAIMGGVIGAVLQSKSQTETA